MQLHWILAALMEASERAQQERGMGGRSAFPAIWRQSVTEGRGRSGNFVAPRCHPYFYWCNQRGSGPRRTQMCLFGRSKNRGIARGALVKQKLKSPMSGFFLPRSSPEQERLPGRSERTARKCEPEKTVGMCGFSPEVLQGLAMQCSTRQQ